MRLAPTARRPRRSSARSLAARPGRRAASDDDVLTIYSGRELDLIGPILEQFADEHGHRHRGPRRHHRRPGAPDRRGGRPARRPTCSCRRARAPSASSTARAASPRCPTTCSTPCPSDGPGRRRALGRRHRAACATLVYNPELDRRGRAARRRCSTLADPRFDGLHRRGARRNASFQDFVTGHAWRARRRRRPGVPRGPGRQRRARPTRTTSPSSTPSTGARSPWG